MFVLGADTDDVQTVRDTVTFAIKNQHRHGDAQHPHAAAGHAAVHDLDAAGRIFDKRWELYDAHHVVFEPGS